jgi:UDP-2,4-diacetamido-2,4,6-trideoxy-beta-L-altropyranose hydrolase
MKNLVIRADGNSQIGTGHVMRCLSLAQAWQDTGGISHFVIAGATPSLEERLRDEGMVVHSIVTLPGSADDVALTTALTRQVEAPWIVVDGYHFDANYQRAIKGSDLRLLFLDDYGHAGHYYADLVLNQNIYADESLYANREPGSNLLLGTRYVLLRREFWPWRDWKRETRPVARKVLITLGGADPDNVTLQVIQALQSAEIQALEAKVVIGVSNPHTEMLQATIRDPKSKIQNRKICLERNVTDMPARMAWADVAISAGGSTCWELAFMGLPNLALILADNQRPLATGLDAAGVAINLGRPAALASAKIAQALAELANAPEKRAAMARRGREVVDGAGAGRIVQRMQNRELTLRSAQSGDCRLIWEWANDPLTRAVSFSSEPIFWQGHVKWFTARLADPNCLFYVALDAAKMPVGQIRYQIQGQEAVVSVSVSPGCRGRGYGSQIIRLASQKVFESTAVNLIHAYVKSDNVASVHSFSKAGFVNQGLAEIRGHSALHLVLQKGMRL